MTPDTRTMGRPPSTADVAREMDDQATQTQEPSHEAHSNAPLLSQEVTQRLHSEWTNIQAGFVDEPRQAVQRAD